MSQTVKMIEPVMGESTDQQQIAEQLFSQAKEQSVSLVGPGGLLGGPAKTVLGPVLEPEMTQHLGDEKHASSSGGNAQRDPATRKLGENALTESIPFLGYHVDICSIICSSNAVESLNARYPARCAPRALPERCAALKCLYLVTRSLDPTGQGRDAGRRSGSQHERLRDQLRRANQLKCARPDPPSI